MKTESWDSVSREFVETPEDVIKFMDEIESVYKKYGLSISHEDGHGAFEIENYSKDNVAWLRCAHLRIRRGR